MLERLESPEEVRAATAGLRGPLAPPGLCPSVPPTPRWGCRLGVSFGQPRRGEPPPPPVTAATGSVRKDAQPPPVFAQLGATPGILGRGRAGPGLAAASPRGSRAAAVGAERSGDIPPRPPPRSARAGRAAPRPSLPFAGCLEEPAALRETQGREGKKPPEVSRLLRDNK